MVMTVCMFVFLFCLLCCLEGTLPEFELLYYVISAVCHGIGIPTGGTIGVPITGFPTDGVPDDPFNLTPEQAACISASPRISNLAAQCSGLDPENVSDIIEFGSIMFMHAL